MTDKAKDGAKEPKAPRPPKEPKESAVKDGAKEPKAPLAASPSEGIPVKAIRTGIYGGTRRRPDRPDAEFRIANESELGSWMKRLDVEAPVEADAPTDAPEAPTNEDVL